MMKKIGLALILIVGIILVVGSWQYQAQIDNLKQAQCFSDTGNYQRALGALEEVEDSFFIRAIDRLPENWRPRFYWQMYYNKGVASFRLQDKIISETPEQEAVAEQSFFLAKKCPDLKADALYYLGLISLKRGNAEQAVQYWQLAVEVDENHFWAKFNLEWIQKPREGQPQEGEGKGAQKAKELLKKATEEMNGKGEGEGNGEVKK